MRLLPRRHVFAIGLLLFAEGRAGAAESADPIRIGILHSQSGTMAISEAPLVSAVQLAVDQINAAGGIRGRRIEPMIVDTRSDPEAAAREAERLITQEGVVSLFGCWTSSCRKAVLPVLQRHRGLLWYPVEYEGRESSPYVIYSGAVPNQQILPAYDWAIGEFGRRQQVPSSGPPRVFLVGSDYVFPRTANLILRERAASRRDIIVGEEYLPLGSTDMGGVVAKIAAARPDIVINTINGDTNANFFAELARASPLRRIPTISFSIAENEIREIGTRLLQGHYVAWSYFQSMDTTENGPFVAAFRQQFGQSAVTSDPIAAAHFQVLAFAEAASDASEIKPEAIRRAAMGLSLITPGGYVRIDATSQHLWKMVRIGEIMPDGQIRVKRDSVVPVEPHPYAGGQEEAPLLLPPDAPPTLTEVSRFMEALSAPAQTPRVAQTLRAMKSLPWSSQERMQAALAAARSPSFLIRYEASRAAEHLDPPRRDLITALLDAPEPFDAVSGLRLLTLEPSVDDALAARAVELLVHGPHRVRLAAGNALLAQGARGWRADTAATSRIVAAFDDVDLGVQRNALALSAFSREFSSRILPVLADMNMGDKPSFFRGPMCETIARVLGDAIAAPAAIRGAASPSVFERAVMKLDRGSCLPATELARLRSSLAQMVSATEKGTFYWVREFFRASVATAILVSLVLSFLLLELGALALALVMLILAPARLIDVLRGLSRLQALRLKIWTLEVNLFAALSPTWLKTNRRALHAWVAAHLPSYRDAFARAGTVESRRTHVLLPTIFSQRTDAVDPTPGEIRALVEGGRLRLQIVGEGGTGKTSLACLVGRWAMASDDNQRIGPPQAGGKRRDFLVAVIFEPGEPLDPTTGSFLAAVQRKLALEGQAIPLWLTTALIEAGLVLVIVDDLSEIPSVTAAVVASPELSGLWLIATSRADLPKEYGDWRAAHPQKLRGRVLTEFFVNYPKMIGHADKLGDNDIENYVKRFKQLLGTDESRQETVVYFARLFLDYVLELQSGSAPAPTTPDRELRHRSPQSVPELVESFVDNTCRHVADRHKIRPVEVVGLIRRVAYLAVANRHRPGPVAVEDLDKQAEVLRRELGMPAQIDLADLLVDTGLLERPSAYYLRFKIDLVNEYCAVLHFRDRLAVGKTKAEAYALWKAWVDEIRSAAEVQPRTSGLLNAIYECLRSDRVAAEVPKDLIAAVAELIGREHDGLQPVRIGILHSLQGTMAISEMPLCDAALLAVEEINQTGGIGGRRLEAIVRDGASDPETFAREASRLVREDGVSSIFGCWTSATRKRVKPVVEATHSLLWYPVQYEGYEQSEAIIYAGAAPNQQIIPAVEWCLGTLLAGRGIEAAQARFYLVGSDYVFPRRANAILRRWLRDKGIQPVGECYAPLGSTDFDAIVADLRACKPQVVINSINGTSNIGFFRALEAAGVNPQDCPVVSLSVAEAEIRDIGARRLRGHYAVWNYFQSLPSPANQRFVSAFQQKFGMGRVTSDPIATAYAQIKIFAEAARRAGELTREELLRQLALVDVDTPAGRIRFDPKTGHFSKRVYVGQANDDGQFDVVGQLSDRGTFDLAALPEEGCLVAPNPFPFADLASSFADEEDRRRTEAEVSMPRP